MLEAPERKQKLVGAAIGLMLRQGFADTSVDEICAQAGVTKGSFFHYFASKEAICQEAMDAWSGGWRSILSNANLDDIEDPLDRLLALFDVMSNTYNLPGQDPGCLVGTVAQEQALSSEAFKTDTRRHLEDWVTGTRQLLADAKKAHTPSTDFDEEEVAWWLCSFVQGTLLISKTGKDREFVLANIRHCRAYIRSLFGLPIGSPPDAR